MFPENSIRVFDQIFKSSKIFDLDNFGECKGLSCNSLPIITSSIICHLLCQGLCLTLST